MPRLLVVTTVPGTIDLFLLPFAEHFRGLGWTVDALASEVPPHHDVMRKSFDRVHEVRWSRNPLHPSNLVIATGEVRRCVAARGYDIVHVHTPVAAFVTRLALRNRRRRRPQIVYTAHGFHFHPGGSALTNAAFLGAERIAGRWTDYLVVMNSEDLRAAHQHRLVPPDRIVFMPGIGVDLSLYGAQPPTPDEGARIREELGIGSGRYVLMIGEISARKRNGDAVRALRDVADRFPDVHLVFAGVGPLEHEVRALARRCGVSDRVHLLGFRRDVPALLRSAAALLLASAQEGLPRCLLEAMSSRVPCVASNIRGSSDLLGGGCGLLFRVGAVDEIAVALGRLLSSPELAREVTARALEKVKQYDIRHVIALHEKLYAEALANMGSDAERAA
jgi:glycosyltransferase involved in cell wall biosynthesis